MCLGTYLLSTTHNWEPKRVCTISSCQRLGALRATRTTRNAAHGGHKAKCVLQRRKRKGQSNAYMLDLSDVLLDVPSTSLYFALVSMVCTCTIPHATSTSFNSHRLWSYDFSSKMKLRSFSSLLPTCESCLLRRTTGRNEGRKSYSLLSCRMHAVLCLTCTSCRQASRRCFRQSLPYEH